MRDDDGHDDAAGARRGASAREPRDGARVALLARSGYGPTRSRVAHGVALEVGQRVHVELETWTGSYVPPREHDAVVTSAERWEYLPHVYGPRRRDTHGHWWGTVDVRVEGESAVRRVSVCRVRAAQVAADAEQA